MILKNINDIRDSYPNIILKPVVSGKGTQITIY